MQRGMTLADLAQKEGHKKVFQLFSGPDSYQQSLNQGLPSQVSFCFKRSLALQLQGMLSTLITCIDIFETCIVTARRKLVTTEILLLAAELHK